MRGQVKWRCKSDAVTKGVPVPSNWPTGGSDRETNLFALANVFAGISEGEEALGWLAASRRHRPE